MEKRIKVLWFASWFPSKHDFLNGDFVERHAHAVSKYADVTILHIVKNEFYQSNLFQIELEQFDGLNIYRGYYRCTSKFGIISKIWSVFLYYYLQIKLYIKVRKIYGVFDLHHVYIIQKQALLLLLLKKMSGIKYLVSEQNGWYMPIGDRHFTKSFFLKNLIKLVFKNATAVHPVSNSLKKNLQQKYPFIKNTFVIPNVVNEEVFFLEEKVNKSNGELNFFAVTGNTYTKNTDGIIRAFSNFLKLGYTATLDIAGPNIDELILLAESLEMKNMITFHNAVPYQTIAKLMKKCDAFIFFTRHETFGCVMIEALFCGKPVIATRIPVLQENLVENENALFVEQENETELTEKLVFFSKTSGTFDNKKIALDAKAKFNYDLVGKQFIEAYNFIL
jgi:glycosyltransferase involved in cell wall biosynthesis